MFDGLSVVKAICSFELKILEGIMRVEGRKAFTGHAATNTVAVKEYLMAVCRRVLIWLSDEESEQLDRWFNNQVK